MTELTITTELKELTPEKSAQVKAVFEPMVKKLEEFEDVYNEIIAEEITPDVCKRAKRIRLDIGKVRIAVDKAHKSEKAHILVAGRAIDGVKNIFKAAISGKEDKLKEIETHFERIEAERILEIQKERISELEQFGQESFPLGLGEMDNQVWNNYLSGVKLNYEAVKEAEAKAEEKREADELAWKTLQARKEVLFPYAAFNPLENLNIETTEEEFKAILSSMEKAQEDHDSEQEAIRAENEQLRKENEEKDRIAVEEKEKFRLAREEADRENERVHAENRAKEEAERKAANAPDKEKLQTISDNILSKLDMFTSEEAKTAMRDAAQVLFEASNRL